eukprot:gene1062-1609_t
MASFFCFTTSTCVKMYPDTHVYVSYKIGHAGDSIIAWHDDSPLWREITESDVGRGDVVVGEVLLRSVDFENGSGKSWSERTRRKSSLSSGSVSYEITIPSGSRLGKRLKCTLTLISGKAELFYGDDVNVMDRSFKESFHGRHSDQFCMNVLYFSCFFACAESVTNLIEILNAANVDLDKAMRWVWTPQNAIVGPNGHNFLHYTAMRWLDATSSDGETPLSTAVLCTNYTAVSEFLKFKPSLYPMIKDDRITSRYTQPKTGVWAVIRNEDETAEANAKVQAMLSSFINEARISSEVAVQDLLNSETSTSAKNTKKKRTKKKKKPIVVEIGMNSDSIRRDCEAMEEPCTATLRELAVDENESEHEKNMCVACFENASCMAFAPCGHMCMCHACAHHDAVTCCPICRRAIDNILRIYCA